jgi:hypothetical protein
MIVAGWHRRSMARLVDKASTPTMPTPTTSKLDDDEPRTEIRFEQHPACGEDGSPIQIKGVICSAVSNTSPMVTRRDRESSPPVDREHRAEAHHKKDQMKKQRDYLKPMRGSTNVERRSTQRLSH